MGLIHIMAMADGTYPTSQRAPHRKVIKRKPKATQPESSTPPEQVEHTPAETPPDSTPAPPPTPPATPDQVTPESEGDAPAA